MGSLEVFCRQVRARSAEHRKAIRLLHGHRVVSQVIAILRQELDSMMRVIFLVSISDSAYRQQLLDASVNGERWTHKAKKVPITDRPMVDLAQSLQGWTQSVYKFGCAFVHLSSFHDHEHRDPLSALPSDEKADILSHMRHYHGGPASDDPSLEDLAPFLPAVFDKISSNLDCYLKQLETEGPTAASAT